MRWHIISMCILVVCLSTNGERACLARLHKTTIVLYDVFYLKMLFFIVTKMDYWWASEASETLSGVTQLKIGDIFLYICLDVRKAFLYFDPRIFVLVWWSTPSQTSLNRILWFINQYPYHPRIELFTFLNSFAVAVKTWKLTGLPLYSS